MICAVVVVKWSDDPSSNPTETYSFFLQDLCLKRIKITKKEAGVGHFFKKNDSIRLVEFSETKLFAENENARCENSFKTRDVKISSFNAADLICSLTHLYLIYQI